VRERGIATIDKRLNVPSSYKTQLHLQQSFCVCFFLILKNLKFSPLQMFGRRQLNLSRM